MIPMHRDRLIHRIAEALMHDETFPELHDKLVIGEEVSEQDFYFCYAAGKLLVPSRIERT